MGLFDKLFGKKKADSGASGVSPQPRQEPVRNLILDISASDLQKGLLRNGICYGASTEDVTGKEALPLSNKGMEKGNPWLIFMEKAGGITTQVIYNFDRNGGELDQISCSFDTAKKSVSDGLYAAYLRHLTEQFAEPVDPKMLKVKMTVQTRAMQKLEVMTLFLKRMGMEPKCEHFDTWLVPIDDGKVKIDLMVLAARGSNADQCTVYLSYKLVPQSYPE